MESRDSRFGGGGDDEDDAERRVSFNRAVFSFDVSLGNATQMSIPSWAVVVECYLVRAL